MKNIKTLGTLAAVGVITLIASMAFLSCGGGGGGGGGTLSGTIQILQYGEPIDPEVGAYTGNPLTAEYSGDEAVTYQWKKNGDDVPADKGGTSQTFTPPEAGSYTVTVSAPGKRSKTSAPVIVTGESIPELSGDIEIQIDNVAVTTAETGQTLTAWYNGDEQVSFSFQWFKDGEALTSYASVNFNTYVPTEPGSYTVRVTNNQYFPKTSAPVEVTGQSLITITFDLNGASGESPTRVIAPGEEITARIPDLPFTPAYSGFSFNGWYTAKTGGTKIENNTVFDEATTVYAQWIFNGGTPVVVGDTLVHPIPLVTAGPNFAGTISQSDGTVTFTAGMFGYEFPSGDYFSLSDYAYFEVRYSGVTSSVEGSGVLIRRYSTTTEYGGTGSLKTFWLSNEQGNGLRYLLDGAGDAGGFSVQHNQGSATLTVKIDSITYYKAARYTVTMDVNGGEALDPTELEVYHGFTMGAELPTPTHSDSSLIFGGWKDDASGRYVTASTPVIGNLSLVAQWLVPADLDPWMEMISTTGTSVPVYGFELPQGETFGDYDRITLKVKMETTSSRQDGRLRAWGNYAWGSGDAGFTFVNGVCTVRPDMQNAEPAGLLLNVAGLVNYSDAIWTVGTIQFTQRDTLTTASTVKAANGIVLIACGLVAGPGASDSRTYYVKDIELSNAAGTKKVPALNPYDTKLWNGTGASVYVGGANNVTRQIMLGEEEQPATPIATKTAPANGTLFSAVDSYADGTAAVTYEHAGNAYWIVADTRSGENNQAAWSASPVDPFDASGATAIETLQKGYGGTNQGYTRLAYDLATEFGADWSRATTVTITYDVVRVAGSNFNVQFRNSLTAAGQTDIGSATTMSNGAGQTLTFVASSISSGGLAIVKSGVPGGILLRITKVELFE